LVLILLTAVMAVVMLGRGVKRQTES